MLEGFSIFSPQMLHERENSGLLVQFILWDLFEAYKSAQVERWEQVISAHPRLFPYDWGVKMGYLNKIQEHVHLLQNSFPNPLIRKLKTTVSKALKIKRFSKVRIKTVLSSIYSATLPLIEACKENENLVFFLLKNRALIEELSSKDHLCRFLQKIHPCGIETLGEKMCDQYHQRGFFAQIPEFKLLLAEL